ncbi:MAG: hypothetical protein ACRDVE_09240 [Actinocrinis sp.]
MQRMTMRSAVLERPIIGRVADRHTRQRVLPRWTTWFFVVAAVVLIPWIVLLFSSQSQQIGVGRHWRLVWGGFDCFLVLGFAATAYRIATRSPRGAITAAATGTMLFVDAWFDVLTSRRPVDRLAAVLMAVFAELPCGLICFFVARRIIGVIESSIPVLRAAGFRLDGGRFVPPPDIAARIAARESGGLDSSDGPDQTWKSDPADL